MNDKGEIDRQLSSIRRLLWMILVVVLVNTVFDRTPIGGADPRALFGLICLAVLVVAGIRGVVLFFWREARLVAEARNAAEKIDK